MPKTTGHYLTPHLSPYRSPLCSLYSTHTGLLSVPDYATLLHEGLCTGPDNPPHIRVAASYSGIRVHLKHLSPEKPFLITRCKVFPIPGRFYGYHGTYNFPRLTFFFICLLIYHLLPY